MLVAIAFLLFVFCSNAAANPHGSEDSGNCNRMFYIITVDSKAICSNGYEAVKPNSKGEVLSFVSVDDCCAEMMKAKKSSDVDEELCPIIDVCVEEPITPLEVTDAPTESPTDEPTPEPTPEPTNSPVSDEPTESPTKAPVTDEPTPSPVTDEPTYEPTTMVMIKETKFPTDKPTCDPTVSPVTPAPTPCGNRLFFIITDIEGVQKCSNGMENVVDSPEAYVSAAECCGALGYFVNPNDKDTPDSACKYIDVCNPTDEPTLSPTLAPVTSDPTPSPVTPAPVTPAPVTPAPVETAEPTSYVTGVETPTSPAPTACEDRKFYIITNIDGETKCSNGLLNSNSGMSSIVVSYETVKDCCDKLVMDGVVDCNKNCKSIDICNPTFEPTLSPTLPPVIAVTTPVPTPAPYDTPFPTQDITPPPVPDEIVTFEPTASSSIGSTPTVGKEMDIIAINSEPRR